MTDLPTFELTYNAVNDRYEGTYDDFTVDGEYLITIYAQDTEELLSEPMQNWVIKGAVEKGDMAIFVIDQQAPRTVVWDVTKPEEYDNSYWRSSVSLKLE